MANSVSRWRVLRRVAVIILGNTATIVVVASLVVGGLFGIAKMGEAYPRVVAGVFAIAVAAIVVVLGLIVLRDMARGFRELWRGAHEAECERVERLGRSSRGRSHG